MSERDLAAWIVQTCLLFGASVPTAHKVAAMFVEGLRSDGFESATPTKGE